jgi:predicted PurR-regulated permease PerM
MTDGTARAIGHFSQQTASQRGRASTLCEVVLISAETSEAPRDPSADASRHDGEGDVRADESTREPVALSAPVRVAVIGMFGFALAAGLFFARSLLLPICIAILLTLLLAPMVQALERVRVPRSLGSGLVVIMLLVLLGALGSYIYAPAQRWITGAPQQFQELREKFERIREPVQAVQDATERISEAAVPEPESQPREVVVEQRSFLGTISATQAYAVGIIITVVLLFFLLASGDMFLRKLIRVIPKFRDKIVAVEIARSIQAQIARYFASITMINICLGVVVAAAMYLLGMPTPALLGTLAALLNFIPYIGSAIMLAVVTFVALISFDEPSQIVLVGLVYLTLNIVEGHLVQPLVLGQRLSMPPVVVFAWVLLWGWLWGVGGVAIAVPMLVVVKICADHIPSWAPLAEFLGSELERPRPADSA